MMNRNSTPPSYLLCEIMYSMAACSSASDSAALPPLGGIAPLPLVADCMRASIPVLMRGAHAALSPSFGAPATPVAWHAVHVVSNTFLPSAAAGAAAAAVGAAAAALGAAGSLNLAPDWFAM